MFPYIALISVFATQMALLGFIFPLYLSRNVSPYGRGLFPCMSERERKGESKKKKKAQKKPLRCDRDLNPWTQSPEPSMLSIRPRHPAQSHKNIITGCKSSRPHRTWPHSFQYEQKLEVPLSDPMLQKKPFVGKFVIYYAWKRPFHLFRLF